MTGKLSAVIRDERQVGTDLKVLLRKSYCFITWKATSTTFLKAHKANVLGMNADV